MSRPSDLVKSAINAEKRLPPIKLASPGGEIGKKELIAVKRRFQNLHTLRLQRIQAFLTARQRAFLELLPLLYHRNHPALPGFISRDTPAGLPDYNPDKQTIRQAKKISKSFVYKKRVLRHYPIRGIYLMGSAGSIAYSKKSDLDIWLCHTPDLSDEPLSELRKKSLAIELWAESLGLEVHFFFIDIEKFRQGVGTPISKESCGNSQHHLLLEEFYRTGLRIAGSIPAWWLVPPHEEQNYDEYVRHLISKRFVSNAEIIDFGGLSHVPIDEFLGATLWHLYKAIDSPHKSLIKLLLMEDYASEHPKTEWISFTLKKAIYNGCLDINKLDPYLMMYKKVEAYLLTLNKNDRLNLARQCFYYKMSENHGKRGKLPANPWRDEIMEPLIHDWKWSKDDLKQLDFRKNWNIEKAINERNLITKELNFSYRALTQFAREHGHDQTTQNDELDLLGRKLRAALEKKPGKVEIINRDIKTRLEEDHFTLQQIQLADGQNGWSLHKGQIDEKNLATHAPLRKAQSLLELLAWIVINGLYHKNSYFNLLTTDNEITTAELHSILNGLSKQIRNRPSEDESLDIYSQPPRLIATALFVNIGLDPMPDMKKGRHLMSNRSDSLSYGSMRKNMIHSVDQILFTSWHEMLIRRYVGLEGFMDCLCDTINLSQRGEISCDLQFDCQSFNSPRARSIALRSKDILRSLIISLNDSPKGSSPRYVLRGENHFYLFNQSSSGLQYWQLDDHEQLNDELAKPQNCFSPVTFDERALEDSPLPAIFAQNRAGFVQIFFLPDDETTELFILDERGSLHQQVLPFKDAKTLLEPITLFLDSILSKGALLQEETSRLPAYKRISYYKIHKDPGEGYRPQQILFFPAVNPAFLELRVVGDNRDDHCNAVTIYCDNTEFSSGEYGNDIYAKVAEEIQSVRSGVQDYPIYITDIDLPPQSLGAIKPSQLQTIHFLQYKQKIENRLNCL